MSDARIDQVIDAWLEGDGTVGPELQGLLRTSAAARQAWWRAMQVHAGLRGALRVRAAHASATRLRPVARRRRQAAPGPGLWLMVAAAALVVIGVGVAMTRPAPVPTPTAPAVAKAEAPLPPIARIIAGAERGRTLAAGEVVRATTALTIALTGEATTLELEPAARLRIDRPAGARIDLLAGAVTIAAAPQPAKTPLLVVTAHAEVRVVGTAFRVAVGGGTAVAVRHGSVSVRSAGSDALIAAGGAAQCDGISPPRLGLPLLRVIEDFSTGIGAWNNNSPRGLVPRPDQGFLDAQGCRLGFQADTEQPSPWAGMAFATTQDWREATGLTLAIRGSGGGGLFELEILDDGPPPRPGQPDQAERFHHVIADDRAGWRELRLPFAAFTRRDMQFPGAANDGLTLSAVQGLSLIETKAPLDLVIDRIGLYRE